MKIQDTKNPRDSWKGCWPDYKDTKLGVISKQNKYVGEWNGSSGIHSYNSTTKETKNKLETMLYQWKFDCFQIINTTEGMNTCHLISNKS